MINTTTTCSALLAKIYRDLRLEYANWELDAIEWTGEALGLIGAFAGQEKLFTTTTVTSHKAAIPSGVLDVLTIYKVEDNKNIRLYPSEDNLSVEQIAEDKYESQPDVYTLNPDYIHTSLESGTLMLEVQKLKTGSDEYPLIPDHQSFREAILWYIQMKLALGGWKHPAGLDYNSIRSEWLRYCTQARGRAMYPSVDEYRNFTKGWVSLISGKPDYDTVYDDEQIVYGQDTFDPRIDGGVL